MREVFAVLVGVVCAVTAFGVVAVVSCIVFVAVGGGAASLTAGGIIGVVAAIGAGHLGARLVLRKRD